MNTKREFCCIYCHDEYDGVTFDFRIIEDKQYLERCFICGKVHMCKPYYVDDVGRANDKRPD